MIEHWIRNYTSTTLSYLLAKKSFIIIGYALKCIAYCLLKGLSTEKSTLDF